MAVEYLVDHPQVPSEAGLEGLTFDGLTVLDVGCGTGKDLLHPAYSHAKERHGIDPRQDRIEYGRSHYPRLKLAQGYAEEMPYPTWHFDFVTSRVGIPYTNVPLALEEIARVLKPGGRLLMTLHDARYQFKHWGQDIRRGNWKMPVDALYVLWASALCCLGFEVPARPWNGSRLTFTSAYCIRKLLRRAGFTQIECERTPTHFIVRAVSVDRAYP